MPYRVGYFVGSLSSTSINRVLATALCTELCDNLISGGVEDLQFYTLNRPHLTREVCHALGVVPQVALQEVA